MQKQNSLQRVLLNSFLLLFLSIYPSSFAALAPALSLMHPIVPLILEYEAQSRI